MSGDSCITPPAPVSVSTLDRTVLGRGIFGTPSEPTLIGLFPPTLVDDGQEGRMGLFDEIVEFEGPEEHDPDISCTGDENMLPNALTIPGSQFPMDPRTVRRIRVDTRAVFAAFPVRRPGVHSETYLASDKIKR